MTNQEKLEKHLKDLERELNSALGNMRLLSAILEVPEPQERRQSVGHLVTDE